MEPVSLLFIGTSEHSIDPKQRLAIPAKYRNQWDANKDGTAWVVIPWPGGILRLYTEADFDWMWWCLQIMKFMIRGVRLFESGN